ncbi:MAG TPA: hypothetical protein VEA19_04295 [Actinomycetota bacterium]|nr:hypothetical protein [Actinomycetota bacterium]
MERVLTLAAAAVLLPGCAGELPDLDGVWVKPGAPVPFRLDIEGRRWALDSGGLRKEGVFDLTERRIAFVLEKTNTPAFDLYCRDAVDVYRWSLQEGRLSMRAVERTCDRAAHAVLTSGSWVRRASGA